ncbi:MAG: ribose-phosphate pyrophosphokinase, partial [Lachnospiraceae bacterium]|nr:ribose-phosphate pyrophosphokinase [Lachnospiraceae bacterium]
FTSGIETFDKATEAGLIDKVYTTNLIYQPPEILQREYYVSVDMSEYLAALIDSFNHDSSIEGLLSPTFKIQKKMAEYQTAGKA